MGKRPTATGPLDGPKRRCFSGVRHGQLSGDVRRNIMFFGHVQALSLNDALRVSQAIMEKVTQYHRRGIELVLVADELHLRVRKTKSE